MQKNKEHVMPSGKFTIIKSDVFVTQNGITKKIKQDDISKEFSKILKQIKNV